MKKILFLVLACVGYALHAAEVRLTKIGMYNPDEVMINSLEWKDMAMGLENKYKSKFDGLKKEEEQLRKAALDYQKKQAVMSEDARKREQDRLVNQERTLQANAKYAMDDYENERRSTTMTFLKKLEDMVTDLGKLNSYDILLPKGPGAYVSATVDMTASLIDHMNKKYTAIKTKK